MIDPSSVMCLPCGLGEMVPSQKNRVLFKHGWWRNEELGIHATFVSKIFQNYFLNEAIHLRISDDSFQRCLNSPIHHVYYNFSKEVLVILETPSLAHMN